MRQPLRARIDLRVTAFLITSTLVAAACGSTLSEEQVIADTGADGLGDLSSTSALPAGARVNEKGQVVDASGEVLGTAEEFGLDVESGGVGGATSGADGSSGSVGGSGGSGTVAAGPAPGVTKNTITLGLGYYDTANAVAGVGAVGVNQGQIDGRRAWEALVDDINERGGIAGRTVEPVYYAFQLTSDNLHRDYQEACARWTQDNQVFAVLEDEAEFFAVEDFLACLARGGAAHVSGQLNKYAFDERVAPRYPLYVAPFTLNFNTQASALVDGLAKQNYFDEEAKLGLILPDLPYTAYATEQSLIPALRRHGLELSSIAQLHHPQNLNEFGQLSSEAASAALKFKTEGITHVMMLDIAGNNAFFYMQAAERQEYRPRYGLTSQSYGTYMVQLIGGEVANNQLKGSRMISWAPTMDVLAADDDFHAENPTYKRCMELMRRNGVAMEDRNVEAVALRFCDRLWILKEIIERGGVETITGNSYIIGIDRLGSSYVSGATFATRISEQIRNGVRAVAPASYFTQCRCYRYTARPYSIPN